MIYNENEIGLNETFQELLSIIQNNSERLEEQESEIELWIRRWNYIYARWKWVHEFKKRFDELKNWQF